MDRTRTLSLILSFSCSCQATAGPTAESAGLEEVVVSARKRAENLQRVPISLTQVSGATLDQRNAARVQDILQFAPNVSTDIQQPRLASVAIRGLGRNPANDGLESSVGVYLDGVYLGRSGMMVTDLVDLQRVEILRGPQGTLFGKNATAGAINLVTREPTETREGWLELTAGDHELRQWKGAISGPVAGDQLALRISGFGTQRRGFTRNTTLGTDLAELDRIGTRAELLWRPGPSQRLRLIADYSSQDEKGPGYLLVDPAIYLESGAIRPNNFLDRTARAGYTPHFAPQERTTDTDTPQRMVAEQSGLSLQLDMPVAAHQLDVIAAWRKWNFRPENDGDATAMIVQPQLGSDARDWQASLEARLASHADGRFDYLGGIYLFHQDMHSEAQTIFGPEAADFLQAGLPAYVLDGYGVNVSADPRTRSYAAFAQTRWRPRDNLELTTGLRWTTESRRASIVRTNSGGVALLPNDAAALDVRARIGAPVSIDAESQEDFLSGLISLSWRPSETAMLYASIARGAKSGGLNVAVVPAGAPQQIEPEDALSYELGFKSQWFARRMQLNLSAFSTSVHDYQATIREPVRGTMYLTNAGAVRSRGAEIEASFLPVPALTMTLAGGWNDARYTSFVNAPCPPETGVAGSCDFSGQRVVGAPPHTLSGTVDYRRSVGNAFGAHGPQVFAGVEFLHSGSYRAELPRATTIEGYEVLHARIGVAAEDGNWSVSLWARNLLDTDYYTTLGSGGSFNTGLVIGLLGEPRSLGLSVRKQF